MKRPTRDELNPRPMFGLRTAADHMRLIAPPIADYVMFDDPWPSKCVDSLDASLRFERFVNAAKHEGRRP